MKIVPQNQIHFQIFAIYILLYNEFVKIHHNSTLKLMICNDFYLKLLKLFQTNQQIYWRYDFENLFRLIFIRLFF